MMVVVFKIGRRKLDGAMPVVGSCSVAISAACHRPDWDTDAAFKPVQYGLTTDDHGIVRASFTSGSVVPLEKNDKEEEQEEKSLTFCQKIWLCCVVF